MKRFALLLLCIILTFSLFACVGGDVSEVASDVSAGTSEDTSIFEESDDVSEDISDNSAFDISAENSSDTSVGDDESFDSSEVIEVIKINDITIDEIKEILFSDVETIKAQHGEPTKEYTLGSNETWYYFESLGFSVGVLSDSTAIDHIMLHSGDALLSLGLDSETLIRIDGEISAEMTFGEVETIWGESEIQSIYDKASGKRTYFAEYSIDGVLFEISTSLSDGSEEAHIVDKILITKE